jgi:hypothetical protein
MMSDGIQASAALEDKLYAQGFRLPPRCGAVAY